jgi:hypothetical protein
MANKPKKTKKRKGKIRVRTGARVVKKDSVRNDTLPKAPARVYPENAAHIKIKIRKK